MQKDSSILFNYRPSKIIIHFTKFHPLIDNLKDRYLIDKMLKLKSTYRWNYTWPWKGWSPLDEATTRC